MDAFAVSVMPVADRTAWEQFIDEVSSGDRAEAHRATLRRLGVTREHIRLQPSPMGDLMVLVWEGVAQEDVAGLFGSLLVDPQSDHERYLGEVVIPVMHGVDLSAGPPPEMQSVATIEV